MDEDQPNTSTDRLEEPQGEADDVSVSAAESSPSVGTSAADPSMAGDVLTHDLNEVTEPAPDPIESAGPQASTESGKQEAPQIGEGAGLNAARDLEEEPVDFEGELEELILPSSVSTLEPLDVGARPDPEGRVEIEILVTTRGRVNRYLALWHGEEGRALPVELLEGPADHAGLQRQAEILSQVRYSMLPTLYAAWERDGRRYLALERFEGATLEQALGEGMQEQQAVSVVLQLTQVLRRLQQAGWALVGLSPSDIYLGQPIRLAGVAMAVRIGEIPPHALQVAGYTAPEVTQQSAVTGKEDVYTLGAVLYRALVREPLSEQGIEVADLPTVTQTPGAPQLLAPALAPVAERVDLDEFYHRLLAFKRRLSQAPLALAVASGTSVGLNPTRLVNEDAYTHLQWSTAHEEGIAHAAVLCVVDGMGGMEAGEVASRAAVQAVLSEATAYSAASAKYRQTGSEISPDAATPDGPPTDAPRPEPLNPAALVKEAARLVYVAAKGRQVGATITCAVVEEGALRLGHVGDTRAYLLRDGALAQLTQDHSLVAAMVASGMLTKEEARGHPESNKVLRSLGGHRELPDEYIDDLSVAYGDEVLHLREGDQLLLCSDGIWGTVADDQLREILLQAPDPEAAVRTGIRRALEGGSPDNATLIVARCVVTPAA